MHASLHSVLESAMAHGDAVAACNVYTLDQAAGVTDAASMLGAPVSLQAHPAGLRDRLWP